jgi:hypothetical protein
LAPIEEGASAVTRVSMDSLYSVEFMNTLQFSGITNHKLKLKVGVPILLLRNLNQSIGLCNGTRLIVKRLDQRVIEAEVITGTMSANLCSYLASSCPHSEIIGHLFCVIVNLLFEWHLR